MRESSLVPTRLLYWPRCSSLVPDIKLILLSLWSSPYLSAAGAGIYPLREAAASLGFDPEALRGGIDALVSAGLVAYDDQTGEIFLLDWFRFHRFRDRRALDILEREIAKIESRHIRAVVLDARQRVSSRGAPPAPDAAPVATPPPAPALAPPARTPAPVTDFVLAAALDSHRAAIRSAAQQAGLDTAQTQTLADEFTGRLRDTSIQPLKMPAAWLKRAAAAVAAGEISKWAQAGAADRASRQNAHAQLHQKQRPENSNSERRLPREEREAMLKNAIDLARS